MVKCACVQGKARSEKGKLEGAGDENRNGETVFEGEMGSRELGEERRRGRERRVVDDEEEGYENESTRGPFSRGGSGRKICEISSLSVGED